MEIRRPSDYEDIVWLRIIEKPRWYKNRYRTDLYYGVPTHLVENYISWVRKENYLSRLVYHLEDNRYAINFEIKCFEVVEDCSYEKAMINNLIVSSENLLKN
jgi:hypothetical protein